MNIYAQGLMNRRFLPLRDEERDPIAEMGIGFMMGWEKSPVYDSMGEQWWLDHFAAKSCKDLRELSKALSVPYFSNTSKQVLCVNLTDYFMNLTSAVKANS